MNLFDMCRRGDPKLAITGEVEPVIEKRPNESWATLRLRPGSQIRVDDIRRFASFRHFPDVTGWFTESVGDASLLVRLETPDGEATTWMPAFPWSDVRLPWPERPAERVDLVLRCNGGTGNSDSAALLHVHRILSKSWLIGEAKGRGLELGPGPSPRIERSDTVDISYLEAMGPEKWHALYNRNGKYPHRPELWQHYVVGDAYDIPLPDESLDFIFGNHVFEHLANPIGHLRRWHRKLAKGGKVLMIIPELRGARDEYQRASTLAEWLDEDEREIWLPERSHYARHLREPLDSPVIARKMNDDISIHVHYYDAVNMEALLHHACLHLGYVNYFIKHTANHKDFQVMLVRD